MASLFDHATLARAIQSGVATGRFGQTCKVEMSEASEEGCTNFMLDETALDEKLEALDTVTNSSHIKVRNFFIPWATFDKVLGITSQAILKLCETVGIPVLFIEGLLDFAYWVRPGNGLFLHQDAAGRPSKLDIFYRYSFGLESGRSYIFTTYDFEKKLTTNVCINFVDKAMPFVGPMCVEIARSDVEQPLALHILLGSHSLDFWNAWGSSMRTTLLNDERGSLEYNSKLATQILHKLSQQLHILLADISSFEEQLMFVAEASEAFHKIQNMPPSPAGLSSEASRIAYLISSCRHTKRWMENYKDRTNIRINLAFHLSTQFDNEINLQISKATTALARDAQRDSSSMITIAAVTMFFLPGTFISAVFSMTFFNFQQDPTTGQQQLQVSDRWWYFLAGTLPLTILVFAVWIIWQRLRFKRFAEEDVIAQEKLSTAIEGEK